MYIATIPNRSSPPAILLRESYRQDGTVKTRTLANLTHWPPAQREALRRVLRGDTLVAPEDAFEIIRSLPHGHVVAVLGTLRRLGLEAIMSANKSQQRDLVVAMIVARLLDPRSKLATARSWNPDTALTSLGQTLGVASADARALYHAMDWLLRRQPQIETALAKRHLREGTLALYDLTSTYFEGHTCPLAQFGHARDGKKGQVQIVCGLVCNAVGCPVAVEVFEGNTGDPTTVAPVIKKLRQRFALRRVVLVGDRGLLTDARIREELKPVEGLDWMTALRHSTIRTLVDSGVLDLAGFARTDLVERELEMIRQATLRAKRPLRGQGNMALRVGKVVNRFKMSKHFVLDMTDAGFQYSRNLPSIAAETALDGVYVLRTSVPAEALDTVSTVCAYKSLATVERAFRSLKTVDLHVRPIGHRLADRVRAHVLLCMLAYYVEWHMRQVLAPMLFDDDDKATAEAQRASVVAPAQRAPRARRKAQTQQTDDGSPVHSFQTLLHDLGTITKNQIRFVHSPLETTEMLTKPTPLQQRALDLLQVSLKL